MHLLKKKKKYVYNKQINIYHTLNTESGFIIFFSYIFHLVHYSLSLFISYVDFKLSDDW